MNSVLTLIADALGQDQLASAQKALPAKSTLTWLNPGKACDLYFDGDPVEIELRVRAALSGEMVDLLAQPLKDRRKELLVADMDSTIITVECIDELADLMGLKDQISAITERAMRGEIDFADALKDRVGKLAGIHRHDVQRVVEERVQLSPGAKTMIRTMRAHGAFTALVSGGFTFFTNQVRQQIGFDTDRANVLDFVDDVLTGKLVAPILDATAKQQFLKEFQETRDLQSAQTIALGDGANDIPMIKEAGLGIAYRAKPAARAAARAAIDHTDLLSVLYFQGYHADEFVH